MQACPHGKTYPYGLVKHCPNLHSIGINSENILQEIKNKPIIERCTQAELKDAPLHKIVNAFSLSISCTNQPGIVGVGFV